MRLWIRSLAIAAIALLLAVDRYSYGKVGGEGAAALDAFHWWQVAAAALMIALIGAGTWLLQLGRADRARFAYLVESCLFILVNVLYLWRDGEGRLILGFEHDRTGLWTLVGGVAARAVLNWSCVAPRRASAKS